MTLNGPGSPYRRGDARYADLHHRLVVVIGQVVLRATSQSEGLENDMMVVRRELFK